MSNTHPRREKPMQKRARSTSHRPWLRPLLEVLEDRTVLATITVTSVADTVAVDGSVTLREAIASIDAGADADADVMADRTGAYQTGASGPDVIDFDIPGSGVQTIALTSGLPQITKPVIIDAQYQPDRPGLEYGHPHRADGHNCGCERDRPEPRRRFRGQHHPRPGG
jgi:hypothetical protein